MAELNVRRRIEDEEENLSVYASRSRSSRGRLRYEEPCNLRTSFQRDRDRIIYSNAFRRLKHKTQVFIAPLGDHYVTRLTHTLEVSQIGRTIARALNLNEDLTEAIALGHDLGHTPFGHLGEDMLNELNPEGFKHNEQSLRIVDVLEKNGQGLNLTWEVRDGIVNHSKSYTRIFDDGWGQAGTAEGQVIKIADIVAYINHDTNDAIRAGVIQESDLPSPVIAVLGQSSSERINTLISDIVNQTYEKIYEGRSKEFKIIMSPEVLDAANTLRGFLFDNVYNSQMAIKDKRKARNIIKLLFNHFLKYPEQLPAEYKLREETVERRVTDYIAGMTDQFALYQSNSVKTGKLKPIPLFS